MLHAPIPIPVRFAHVDSEKRMPPGAGILIAMAGSIVMWGVIYVIYVLAVSVLCF